MSAELSQMTDGLGKGIDKGIIDTVIGLNVLGITTRQSCEGHVDWGTGAPWVDVEATGPKVEELEQKAREAWEVAENAERQHATEDELQKVFGEAHRARREERVEHLKVAKKMLTYLDEFYTNRQVPANQRLVLTYHASRLESQGAAFQDLAEPDVKQQKLLKYQAEMKAFTEFLKEKYYADETPTEPGEEIANNLNEMRLKFIAEHSPNNSESSVNESTTTTTE
jgi:hypothetical protein